MNLIELDGLDLGWTLLLLGMAIALAAWQRVGLAGQLAWAGARALLQLLIV
ncbi:MAG: ABC transporter permease, partial [Microcystaceae cyanobacterium]